MSSTLFLTLILSAYDSFLLSDPSNQIQSQVLNPLINSAIINLSQFFRLWSDPIRQLRTEPGLPPVENPLFEGQNSPELVLALFSQVCAKCQTDWPKQTRVTGFVFYDRQNSAVLAPELSRFLDAEPALIVFTLGSATVHVAGDFYIEQYHSN